MSQIMEFKVKGEIGYEDTPVTPSNLNGNFKAILEALGLDKDTYDNTSTYKVDDIVCIKYKLYSCIVEITAPEEWNPEHWQECPIFVQEKGVE